jgi:hypothetical protein
MSIPRFADRDTPQPLKRRGFSLVREKPARLGEVNTSHRSREYFDQ